MYKMKDVCRMTGLTEKAIRLYMEKKLVEPKVEEGVHRNAYYFEEEDVERLKDIATLRSAGFGLGDIKMMLDDPTNISSLVEERESLLKREIEQMKSLRRSMNNLTINEYTDVTKFTEAMSMDAPKKETSRLVMRLLYAGALMLTVLIILLFYGEFRAVYSAMFGICLVNGPIAIYWGIRYLLHEGKARDRECSGFGKVVAIISNEHIEDYILQEGEKGENDYPELLLWGMSRKALWNRLRWDHWYPVIRYEAEDGSLQIGTVRYGGFKNTWKVGDSISIAWDSKWKKMVYEKNGKGFRKIALLYIIIGILMLIFAISVFVWEIAHIVMPIR